MTNRKVAYLMDARYDGFLPTVWLAFGLGEPRFDFANARVPELEPATIHYASSNEPRLKQDEGMFFACSDFRPHPIVHALAEEAKTRKTFVYQGQRYLGWPSDSLWKTQHWMPAGIYYYNTPHVSMGSVHSDGGILQSRYNSTIFAADPSQGLRIEIALPDVPSHKRRYEARGRVVQHKNWLLGQGTLYEDGGIQSHKLGPWNLYRVGKGLCSHMELPDSYHLLQISDLDTHTNEQAFIAALSVPKKEDNRVEATTIDGDRVAVDLTDMSISVNGTLRPPSTENAPRLPVDAVGVRQRPDHHPNEIRLRHLRQRRNMPTPLPHAATDQRRLPLGKPNLRRLHNQGQPHPSPRRHVARHRHDTQIHLDPPPRRHRCTGPTRRLRRRQP